MRYRREDGCRAWLIYGQLQPETLVNVLDEFGSAEAIYDRFLKDGGACLKPYVQEQLFEMLTAQSKPDAMHRMMVTMAKLGAGVVAISDYRYPDALRDLPDPPGLLFYQGDLDCLMGKCITMVGSRSASPASLAATEQIARELSRSGATVVSGLAPGIDTASHEGCLAGGSPTCAVLACGLDVEYPSGSRQLRKRILDRGGVILTEYPLGCPALNWHFPVRNRILSGLSKAVVLMEARIRSGSMTTVQHALTQGREVYAYPGQVGTEWAEGAHQLLREGANYFTSAADILEDLSWNDGRPAAAPQTKQQLPELTPDQRRVYQQLALGEQSYEQLAEATGMDPAALSGALTLLQIMGLIRPMPGKTYCKV